MTRSVALVLAGLLIGLLFMRQEPARAEVRRATPQQAFSSGAMRSEAVLTEIAGILRKMDKRLASLESNVSKISAFQSAKGSHAP